MEDYAGYLIMKKYKNLFEKIASFASLYDAYLEVRKGKRNQHQYMMFELRLEENLINLLEHLNHGTYKPSGYRQITILEPKKRTISAPKSFADKVLQQAIIDVLEPIFEPRFIFDNYACRIGKGTHKGADQSQKYLRDCLLEHGTVSVLKADIRSYFASIDHKILKSLLAKRIGDERLLNLLYIIIDSYHTPGTPGVGIPLGNRTSQLFANIYLDALDQHIKHTLKIQRYVRYMDDFVIISHDKQYLHSLRFGLSVWLNDNLALEFNHKTRVITVGPNYKQGQGLDFLGYHLWPYGRRLRKASLKRFKRRVRLLQKQYAAGDITMKEVMEQLSSWLAHARHGNAEKVIENFLENHTFKRDPNGKPNSRAKALQGVGERRS